MSTSELQTADSSNSIHDSLSGSESKRCRAVRQEHCFRRYLFGETHGNVEPPAAVYNPRCISAYPDRSTCRLDCGLVGSRPDYVTCWFKKASDYAVHTKVIFAFVCTNSICQGEHVPIIWPLIYEKNQDIVFAHTSFKWANLASHNAGVTVAIIGISRQAGTVRRLFDDEKGKTSVREVTNINAYLVPGQSVEVEKNSSPINALLAMSNGNKPTDGPSRICKIFR